MSKQVIKYILAVVIVLAAGVGIFIGVFSLTKETTETVKITDDKPAVVTFGSPDTKAITEATAPSVSVNGTAVNDAQNTILPELRNSYSSSDLSYSFDFYDSSDNKYIVTAEPDEEKNILMLNAEDNNYNLSSVYVTAPKGYEIKYPCTKTISGYFNYNAETGLFYPYMLQVNFYSDSIDLPPVVSSFYAVKSGNLHQIKLIDNTGEQPVELSYTADTNLYFSERNTLMSDIKIVSGEKSDVPEIFTYTFNDSEFSLTKNKEEFSEDNQPYFGYGCYALANNVYRYFTTDNYKINAEDGYYEIPVIDQDSSSGDYLYSDFYFAVDDSRFNTVDSLRAYVRTLFSSDITDNMFASAPQKYKDFDGILHTVSVKSEPNKPLGRIVINDWEEYDDNTYKSKTYDIVQELLDEDGNVIGYSNLPNFKIEHYSNMAEAFPGYTQDCWGAVPTDWVITNFDYNYDFKLKQNQ